MTHAFLTLNTGIKLGAKCQLVSGVSGVWQAWHVPWASRWRERKNHLEKIKIFIYSFLNSYFALHTFINCKAASTQRPYVMH